MNVEVPDHISLIEKAFADNHMVFLRKTVTGDDSIIYSFHNDQYDVGVDVYSSGSIVVIVIDKTQTTHYTNVCELEIEDIKLIVAELKDCGFPTNTN